MKGVSADPLVPILLSHGQLTLLDCYTSTDTQHTVLAGNICSSFALQLNIKDR
jgi:hypothetical protein